MILNLNDFMNKEIKNISEAAKRFYLNSPRGCAAMLNIASSLMKGVNIRKKYERKGINIPPFIIASISSNCNLKCAGCYAQASGNCTSNEGKVKMNLEDWQKIFQEASNIGVSFIFLAGGEPLLCPDIIKLASEFKNIIFPIFTNGTIINESYLNIFDKCRNLIPVLSIEGDDIKTDSRRGKGVSEKVWYAASMLKEKDILYGVSITVTNENKECVTEGSFVNMLKNRGCGLIFYVEYVPVEENTEHLILNDDDLKKLQLRIDELRHDKQNKGMIILSFPGDEEAMGGCLAAGRGFFHINSQGGAEPCPFSPYSEINIKDKSILEVLNSPFFEKIRKISASEVLNHKGGCTLFQNKEKVIKAVEEGM